MSYALIGTLVVVVGVVIALAKETFTPAVTMLAGVIALVIAQIVEPGDALGGFASSATWTIAGLFIVARTLKLHLGLDQKVSRMLGSSSNDRVILSRLVAPVAMASTVIANTPLVATLAPVVREWAERNAKPASKYLIPLSFATILGGVATTIGTSTTLVVSGLVVEAGFPAFTLFEVLPVGLPVAVIGGTVLVLLAPSVLPDRRSSFAHVASHARDYTFRLAVIGGGTADGHTVEGAGLRGLDSAYLASIQRGAAIEITPVAPDTVLSAGDILTFVGQVDRVLDLTKGTGLRLAAETQADSLDGDSHKLFEVVLGTNSPLVGRTPKGVSFRGRYRAAIVAVHRQGHRVDGKLGEVRLEPGDALVLMAREEFAERWRDRNDFAVIVALGESQSPPPTRQAFVVGVTGAMLFAAGLGVDLLSAVLAACVIFIASGSIRLLEARSSVDVDVIVLIGSAIGLGASVQASGLADQGAQLITWVASAGSSVLALLTILVGTLILTEMITNVAAAALMLPIAIDVAARVGSDPRGYAVAVAVLASSSYLTPIGYQTNTIVYGLGGYRFSDYWRLGAPLTAITLVLTTVMVSWVWG